ncbi:NADH:flavin oxidoreductase/NADH oxidase [Rhizobium sp. P38BS-XIX]|uniref:NADH:flavin oxidoreductase/NADH oxidase n=1 Tax=Rhizobium sp. P38BS-XIX TaxID=2726740 RepID=UPI0014578B44|nr:NADH:flavin oxidoreductase/NADH oxidase [Rhizobium sp. P38BS-XIX]NLS00823.1 NADH:flavin oxidoreductase/NADH oxidase [Rhizobium sp. P38BS-XIX]
MPNTLFSPLTLGPNTFSNRIAIAPMAQYSAVDGAAGDWHLMHWGSLVTGGAGLVVIEATGVEANGRPTLGDVGIYNDMTESALRQVISAVRGFGAAKLGIQLIHGGRKGSTRVHWDGGGELLPSEGGWQTMAPSAIPYRDGWQVPREMDIADIERVKKAFVDAALRSSRVGFDVIELQAAHGYLLHQFLSPISNKRTDRYGGPLENRMRFALEVFDAVSKSCPASVTLGVRLTGSDWIDGGITTEEAIIFAARLKDLGCHYVDVSSGALDPQRQKISVGRDYQVGFAEAVKHGAGIPVRAVGLITSPTQANDIIVSEKADQIAIARAALVNPRWVWQAAQQMGQKIEYPKPYDRAAPGVWPGWGYDY